MWLRRLTPGVPRAEEIDTAREEAGLEKTKHCSQGGKLTKVIDETHTDHDGAPECGDGCEVDAGTDLTDEDGGRGLEDDVGDEEDQVGNVLGLCQRIYLLVPSRPRNTHVSEAGEIKLNTHTRNVGSTHVGPVHERHAVHSTHSRNQSSIDTSDNLLLLIGRESMIVILLRANLARSVIEVFEVALRLDIGLVYTVLLLHVVVVVVVVVVDDDDGLYVGGEK